MTAIVAIDPGPHAGIAIRVDDNPIETMLFHEEAPQLYKFIYELAPSVIVTERFQPYQTHQMRVSSDGLVTIEMVGACQCLAVLLDAQIVLQTAAQRKPWESLARKHLHASHAKIESHEVDALSHLMRYEQMTRRNKASGIELPHQLFGKQE